MDSGHWKWSGSSVLVSNAGYNLVKAAIEAGQDVFVEKPLCLDNLPAWGPFRPAISLLSEVEFCAAVARKLREGALSEVDATRILTRFRLHIDEGYYERLPIDATHHEIARDWMGRFAAPLRMLDALHLAVCFASDAVLLTADARLAKAAHHFRVPKELLARVKA